MAWGRNCVLRSGEPGYEQEERGHGEKLVGHERSVRGHSVVISRF